MYVQLQQHLSRDQMNFQQNKRLYGVQVQLREKITCTCLHLVGLFRSIHLLHALAQSVQIILIYSIQLKTILYITNRITLGVAQLFINCMTYTSRHVQISSRSHDCYGSRWHHRWDNKLVVLPFTVSICPMCTFTGLIYLYVGW